jgi:hypothetical protein
MFQPDGEVETESSGEEAPAPVRKRKATVPRVRANGVKKGKRPEVTTDHQTEAVEGSQGLKQDNPLFSEFFQKLLLIL